MMLDTPPQESPASDSVVVTEQPAPEYVPAEPIVGEPETAPEPEAETSDPAQTDAAPAIEAPEEEHQFPVSDVPTLEPGQTTDSDILRVARDVIAGQWGPESEWEERLTISGYDYERISAQITELLNPGSVVYRNYSVQPGDTLKGIAGRIDYKGGYKALFERNRGVIGNDPNAGLSVGQVLSL